MLASQFNSKGRASIQMGTRFKRPCLDCGALAHGSRCPQHQAIVDARNAERQNNPARRQKKSQLYNYAYRKEARVVKQNATHCHICLQPFTSIDEVEADHLYPGVGGSPLLPSHKKCNRARGDKPIEDVRRKPEDR